MTDADTALTDLGASGAFRPPSLRSPRAARIHDALLAAILDHRLAPGQRLPEDELGAIYGASRTIVRSALQALAHDRLVTMQPNKGAQVAEPSAEEARQVFEARSVIEPRLAAMAAKQAGVKEAALLKRHIRDEGKALRSGDTGRSIALSGAFHIAIAEMARQPILAGYVRELVSRSSLIIALYWHRPDAICERHAHRALAEAIGNGEGRRAADLMLSHLVDVLSGLHLRPRKSENATLGDMLSGGFATSSA